MKLRERRDVGGGDDATGGSFNKKPVGAGAVKKCNQAASSSGDTKKPMSKSKAKIRAILSSMSKTTKSTNQERTTIPNLGLVTDRRVRP